MSETKPPNDAFVRISFSVWKRGLLLFCLAVAPPIAHMAFTSWQCARLEEELDKALESLREGKLERTRLDWNGGILSPLMVQWGIAIVPAESSETVYNERKENSNRFVAPIALQSESRPIAPADVARQYESSIVFVLIAAAALALGISSKIASQIAEVVLALLIAMEAALTLIAVF